MTLPLMPSHIIPCGPLLAVSPLAHCSFHSFIPLSQIPALCLPRLPLWDYPHIRTGNSTWSKMLSSADILHGFVLTHFWGSYFP